MIKEKYNCVNTEIKHGVPVIHLSDGKGFPLCGHRKNVTKKWNKIEAFPDCFKCALKQEDYELRMEILHRRYREMKKMGFGSK
jgi:hypothetical protein